VKEVPDLAKARVLIMTKVSMYDRKLFKILLSTIPPWATIIGIGDKTDPSGGRVKTPRTSAVLYPQRTSINAS
jgi:hypothetical protein